jgi:hypothetical protein
LFILCYEKIHAFLLPLTNTDFSSNVRLNNSQPIRCGTSFTVSGTFGLLEHRSVFPSAGHTDGLIFKGTRDAVTHCPILRREDGTFIGNWSPILLEAPKMALPRRRRERHLGESPAIVERIIETEHFVFGLVLTSSDEPMGWIMIRLTRQGLVALPNWSEQNGSVLYVLLISSSLHWRGSITQ